VQYSLAYNRQTVYTYYTGEVTGEDADPVCDLAHFLYFHGAFFWSMHTICRPESRYKNPQQTQAQTGWTHATVGSVRPHRRAVSVRSHIQSVACRGPPACFERKYIHNLIHAYFFDDIQIVGHFMGMKSLGILSCWTTW
jgi:hypothetical protein